jgi:O-antigen/teichoic acid export membrane protein
MSNSLFSEQQSAFVPAGLLVLARIGNMVISLGMIPVLIHFLGGGGFAAWAMLLATSAAFAALEIGMAPTFIKHAAPLIQQRNWLQVNFVLSQATIILLLAFALAAPLVFWFADDVANSLQLPDDEWLSAEQMIMFVYVSVALRAVLQFGAHTFNAARRFRALAAVSFLQSFAANCAATVAAIWTGRVDITLIAFWGSQVVVMIATIIAARQFYAWRIASAVPRLGMLREMASHGLKIQVCDWAQIINFQFDKFLIASYMGLWTVAPYEVANRSVLALRSVPSSGLDSFLATAVIGRESGDDPWPRYQTVTRLAMLAVVVFMLAPLAVAPVFLYAWTGEMGYSARWVFLFLLLGAAGSLLALPAALMAQAAGRADIQARSAIVSMLVNIPLSIFLMLKWDMAGAAAGTAIAMLTGSALLLVQVHRAYGQRLSTTMANMGQPWPLFIVCLGFGALVYYPFELWLTSLDPVVRYSWETRLYLGLATAAAYFACLATMAVLQIHRGALSRDQYDFLSRWIQFKWFVAYCATKAPSKGEMAS